MIKLYILRHADASWAQPGQRDIERTLSNRGLDQLLNLREIITDNDYSFDKVLCSSATRTRQTCDGIKKVFGPSTQIEIVPELYACETEDYLEFVRAQKYINSLLIIGHNPMCAGLAMQLMHTGSDEAMRKISTGYPSGTLSVLEIDKDDWQDVSYQSANLLRVLTPKP